MRGRERDPDARTTVVKPRCPEDVPPVTDEQREALKREALAGAPVADLLLRYERRLAEVETDFARLKRVEGETAAYWCRDSKLNEKRADDLETERDAVQARVHELRWICERALTKAEAADSPSLSREGVVGTLQAVRFILAGALSKDEVPIPMILHCPSCGLQHIDALEPENDWDNPPHRTHLCHGCGNLWRPAPVNTTGVESLEGTDGG